LKVTRYGGLPWTEERNENLQRKYLVNNLFKDPDTGMEVLLVRYPAGGSSSAHASLFPRDICPGRHPGDTLGPLPPGAFVWFPEGLEMEHGAAAERDVTVLFVTNKSFSINCI
jgi:hypothetical protein